MYDNNLFPWNRTTNSIRPVQTIQRLTVPETAKLVGKKPQDLYNAYSNGQVGGYIQKDYSTRSKNGRPSLYVLESDVHKLRELLAQRAAGPVKHAYTYEARKIMEIAASEPMKAIVEPRKRVYAPGVREAMNAAASERMKSCWAAKRAQQESQAKAASERSAQSHAVVRQVYAQDDAGKRQTIAIELITAGFTDAGVYLLTGKKA
jgi:hypothetical protein